MLKSSRTNGKGESSETNYVHPIHCGNPVLRAVLPALWVLRNHMLGEGAIIKSVV